MKNFSSYIALSVAFFVIFLGMRNPWLDHKPGPKRKARAVITQTFSKNFSISFDKSSKDHDNTMPVATVLSPTMIEDVPLTVTALSIREQIIPSLRCLSPCSSRAPPTIS